MVPFGSEPIARFDLFGVSVAELCLAWSSNLTYVDNVLGQWLVQRVGAVASQANAALLLYGKDAYPPLHIMSLDVTSVIGLMNGDQFQLRVGAWSSVSLPHTRHRSILVSRCWVQVI